MNVLLVDDQEIIVNSIKKTLPWEELGVDEVYTANNASQAKFLLTNFIIDLLITDIEMPEENGISLAEWARKAFPDIIIVFLTAHPDFNYAQEGVRLQIFDYLLQPVRFSALQDVIIRAGKVLLSRRETATVERSYRFNRQHKNAIFDSIVLKCLRDQETDILNIFQTVVELYESEHGPCDVYPLLVEIRQWERVREKWDDDLLRTTISNILTELFTEQEAEVCVANVEAGEYWAFLLMRRDSISREKYQARIVSFCEVFNKRRTTGVRAAGLDTPLRTNLSHQVQLLKKRLENSPSEEITVFSDIYDDLESEPGLIEQATAYIKEHIFQKLSRGEVAEHVHLNQEYFSRLFRKETGLSFKDYVLKEKMKRAANMLSSTSLSVGLIASKVGFDNFSHFSQTFRKYYNLSPQEYRETSGK